MIPARMLAERSSGTQKVFSRLSRRMSPPKIPVPCEKKTVESWASDWYGPIAWFPVRP